MYSLKSTKGVYHLHEGITQTMFLKRMVKGMHTRIPIASSINFPMTSTMVSYILNDLELKFLTPETDHESRILVIVTGAYLVITFGYSICGN